MARILIGNVWDIEGLSKHFAPAGYGLGMKNGHDCEDCNEAILNGTYYIFGESAVNHPGNNMQYGCMDVKRRGSYITQVIHYDCYETKRFSRDGGETWGEWEWDNPPMMVGVEYRTTERYMGKPVYVKLVDCNGMPSANSMKTVEHGIVAMHHIVGFGGEMLPSYANAISLPYRYSDENYAHLCVDSKKVQIENGATDLASYTNVHVWIKYTKTTD